MDCFHHYSALWLSFDNETEHSKRQEELYTSGVVSLLGCYRSNTRGICCRELLGIQESCLRCLCFFSSFLCLYIRKPSRSGKILQALDQSLSTIIFCIFLLGNNSRGSKLLPCSNFCTWLFYAYDAQRVALCYSCSVGIYACGRFRCAKSSS